MRCVPHMTLRRPRHDMPIPDQQRACASEAQRHPAFLMRRTSAAISVSSSAAFAQTAQEAEEQEDGFAMHGRKTWAWRIAYVLRTRLAAPFAAYPTPAKLTSLLGGC